MNVWSEDCRELRATIDTPYGSERYSTAATSSGSQPNFAPTVSTDRPCVGTAQSVGNGYTWDGCVEADPDVGEAVGEDVSEGSTDGVPPPDGRTEPPPCSTANDPDASAIAATAATTDQVRRRRARPCRTASSGSTREGGAEASAVFTRSAICTASSSPCT
ncbi:hypothetical protein [Kitasatospora setae]|nr:hypothetical protein [Kitasatospora setae]